MLWLGLALFAMFFAGLLLLVIETGGFSSQAELAKRARFDTVGGTLLLLSLLGFMAFLFVARRHLKDDVPRSVTEARAERAQERGEVVEEQAELAEAVRPHLVSGETIQAELAEASRGYFGRGALRRISLVVTSRHVFMLGWVRIPGTPWREATYDLSVIGHEPREQVRVELVRNHPRLTLRARFGTQAFVFSVRAEYEDDALAIADLLATNSSQELRDRTRRLDAGEDIYKAVQADDDSTSR
jgi:hypothetical protein